MKRTFFKPAPIALMALAAALTWGCSKTEEKPSPAQQQANAQAAAQDNSQMIAATQEMMDVTSGAFAEKGITNGRTISEGREMTWGCKPTVSGTFKLDTSFPDSLIYSGSLTLDYGTGANCDKENKRTGKITDNFIYNVSLKRKLFSSSESVTFEAFSKDTVKFDGNVTIKSATKSATTVESQGTKITYADGTASQWNGMLSFVYEKAENCRDWRGGNINLTGSLNGTTREQRQFSASISKDIVFTNTCGSKHQFIPVSGTIDITTDGASSVVDYGTGTCDKTYTVTAGGTTTVHTGINPRCKTVASIQ